MGGYKSLRIWQNGMEICDMIYTLTKTFPKSEKYAICDQLNRASVSVVSNIAEVYSRGTEKGFIQFLRYSLGSAYEIETQLHVSMRQGFGSKSKVLEILDLLTIEQKMIYSFITRLKSDSKNP